MLLLAEEVLPKENNRIVEVHTIPFQDTDGTWKVFEFNIDITKRKQAEEKLKASEERLDRAMAVKNEGIWDWNLVTNETFFDERYYTMAGYAPNEFPQNFTAWAQHVHPDDLPGANSAIQDYFSGKSKNYDIEFRFRHKKGSWIWIRGQGKIVARDAKGKPLRMVGTHIDITEHKMVEENFRRSIDDSPLGVRISTKQAETVYANRAILDMYGYKNFEEFKNTPVKDRYTPQSYAEYLLRSKERKQGKLGPSEYEISIVRKNGEIRHLRAFRKEILWNGEKQAQIIYMDITERKQAQEKLQQSEENFRLTFNSTSDVIFSLDTQLRLNEITPSVEKVLGYNTEELNGKSLPSLNIMSPESREKASQHVRKILSGKYAPPAVYEFILKDGRKGFGEITASPIIKDNKIIGVTCVSRDITERLKTEAEKQGALVALRQSEEKYRNILENIEDGYYEVDLAGNLTFFNDSVCRISGYAREELMGMNNRQYTAPENIKEILKTFNQVYATGIPAKGFDWKIIDKDGEKRSFEASVSLMKDVSNKPTGFRGIVRDVTERKKAQEKLRQSEENYRNLFDNSKEGILIAQNEKINFANPALVEMLGYPIDIIKNKPFTFFIHPEDSKKVLDRHLKRLRGEDVETNYDFRIITGDGTEKWLRIKSQIISWDGLPSSLSFIEDITERKKAEEALRENEDRFRRISEVSSDIAYSCSAEEDGTFSLEWMTGATKQITGYSLDEIMAQECWRFLVIDDDIATFEKNVTGLTPGSHGSCELRIRHKNGSIIYVNSLAECVLDQKIPGRLLLYGGLVDITERKQTEALLKTRMNLMEYSLTHSLGELLQKTLDEICAFTGSLIGFYHFVEPDQKTLSLQAWSTKTVEEFCKAEGYGMHYNIDQAGVWVDCLREGRPVIHNDYASLPHRKGLPEGHAAVIRELAVPISRKGLFVAVLGVGNKPQDYTEKDIEIVSYLADVAWEIAERKKVEDALRESEYNMRKSQEAARFGSYNLDVKKGTWISSTVLDDIFGIDDSYPKNVEGWGNLLHPDDKEEMLSYLSDHVVRQHNLFEKEYRIIRINDKQVRWVFGQGELTIDKDGVVTNMIGTIQDINNRKLAEQALEESEEKYRLIFEHSPLGLLYFDQNGIILACNEKFVNITGTSREVLIGLNMLNLPDKGIVSAVRQALSGSAGFYDDMYDTVIVPKITPIRALFTPMNSEGGIVQGGVGIIEDVTEQKKAQETLRQSEEKYRSLIENAQEGVYQTSPDGKFMTVNNGFARILGYNSAQEILEAVTDISNQLYVYPQDRGRLLKIVKKYGSVTNFETQFYRKDGSRLWVSLSSNAALDDQKQVLYYQGMVQDISEKKQIEVERAENVKTLRKSLGATISAMAVMVETRDPYTAGHQRRVADLARAIATEMKLPSDQIDGVRMAGMLHDVGKISIPSEILTKPTQLTVLEFNLIKTHPVSGYEILKDIEFPWPIARIVLEHHERVNASGYPHGLKENEILLESKIMAVADVMEAISSHRPYRPAHGIEAGLQEIEKNKGILYDVDVANACLRLFREKSYILAA